MDDDQISRNIAFANAVAEKYGYETVPVQEIYETYERISKLREWGFVAVKPGLYCQQIDDSIVRVVSLQPWKGGIYAPVCGVSLSFMPHAWDPKLRWHKGTKAPRFDLSERRLGLTRNPGEEQRLTETGAISAGHGKAYMQLNCMSVTRWSDPDISAWFAAIGSLEDLLAIARRQAADEETYGTHSPQPRLVAIFLLARLGRTEEARAEFEKYPIEWETEIGREMLARGLEEVCSGKRI